MANLFHDKGIHYNVYTDAVKTQIVASAERVIIVVTAIIRQLWGLNFYELF